MRPSAPPVCHHGYTTREISPRVLRRLPAPEGRPVVWSRPRATRVGRRPAQTRPGRERVSPGTVSTARGAPDGSARLCVWSRLPGGARWAPPGANPARKGAGWPNRPCRRRGFGVLGTQNHPCGGFRCQERGNSERSAGDLAPGPVLVPSRLSPSAHRRSVPPLTSGDSPRGRRRRPVTASRRRRPAHEAGDDDARRGPDRRPPHELGPPVAGGSDPARHRGERHPPAAAVGA